MRGFQVLLCQYGRNDYCCCYVSKLTLNANNAVICVRSTVLISIYLVPDINISYSTPGILFLALKGSTIQSHAPTLKFRVDGER